MTFEKRIFGKDPKNPTVITNEDPALSESGGRAKEEGRNPEQIETQLCAGFDTALQELKKNPDDLHRRIEQLKNNHDTLKQMATGGYFTEEHWEMAATLEFYDQRTFDHSLRVLQFVQTIAIGDGDTAQYLKERMGIENEHDEHTAFQDFFVAALFHDIGKTAIPCEILHDHTTRREWAEHANRWAEKNNREPYFDASTLQEPEHGGLEETELDDYFMKIRREKGYEPLDIVPLQEVFDEATLTELEAHGIQRTGTFRKVLERHESATKAVLRRKKMYVASDIASLHHGYEERTIRKERYPTETSALRIAYALSMIRSMDVYDALTSSDRSYKQPHHPLLGMRILLREALHEFTELELTQKIVSDLYKKFQKGSDYEKYILQARTIEELEKKQGLTPTQSQFVSKGKQLLSAEKEILEFIQKPLITDHVEGNVQKVA